MAASGFGPKVLGLMMKVRPGSVGLMAENLVRFVSWQNPMAICLAIVAAPAAIRTSPNSTRPRSAIPRCVRCCGVPGSPSCARHRGSTACAKP